MTYLLTKLLLVVVGPIYYVAFTWLVERIELEKLRARWTYGSRKRVHLARLVGYVAAVYVVIFAVPAAIVLW